MVALSFVLLTAVVSVSATLSTEEKLFASLLKRQEPGSPAFECHSNCGSGISLLKAGGDVCENEAFLSAYEKCLQCAGPDNVNIWRYYGNTLGAAGEACGLDTTPAPGAASPSATPEPTVTPAPTSASPTSESAEAPAPISESAAETTGYEAPESFHSSIETPSIPAHVETPISSTVVAYTNASGTGTPSPTGNGTSSFTVPPPAEQTDNAASSVRFSNAAGILGAVAMGIMYGF